MELLLYLLFVLDKISGICILLMIISGMFFGITFLTMVVESTNSYHDDSEIFMFKKITKLSIIVFLACIPFVVLIPSPKEVVAIYTVPKIVNNETISQECQELYDLGKEYLKNAVENQED